MSTKQQRTALRAAIDKVVKLELRVERTYTDLIRTRDEEERRRDEFTYELHEAYSEMNALIEKL